MLYKTTTTCRSESNRESLHQTQCGPIPISRKYQADNAPLTLGFSTRLSVQVSSSAGHVMTGSRPAPSGNTAKVTAP